MKPFEAKKWILISLLNFQDLCPTTQNQQIAPFFLIFRLLPMIESFCFALNNFIMISLETISGSTVAYILLSFFWSFLNNRRTLYGIALDLDDLDEENERVHQAIRYRYRTSHQITAKRR